MKKYKTKGFKYTLFSIAILSVGVLIWSCTEKEAFRDGSEMNRQEQWIADLNFFENNYIPNSKTFSKDSILACQTLLDSLRKNVDGLSDNQIILGLSKAVAMANNGHTTIHLSEMNKIPVRFYWFADGLYIIKTDKASMKHLGSKVLEINSVGLERVYKKMKPHLSGIEGFKKFTASNYLNSPEILNGLGMANTDSLELTLLKENDTIIANFGTKKMPNTKYEYETWADLFPSSAETDSWSHVLGQSESLPLYLENMERGVSYSFMDTEKVAYFSINALWYNCEDFEGTIDEFIDTLKLKRDYNVILDLRYYTGGNFLIPTKLATEPPEIIDEDKKIYLITSSKTFSAGLVTAARIKYFAKEKIVVVGEKVGDNLKFWAEGEYYKLPYSGIKIQDSKYEHDWADDSFTLGRTFWVNAFYGVAAKDLEVDEKIPVSFEAYKNYRDPILEWILEHKK
ncbi:hypothetical protein ACFQZJ_13215 [Maribacter chungangensis]|uniref:Peptidase S41 n=1 Tax=Maribacter chungangensis TaxID=1069117 RepID=A0ABW3B678_9FLAO